MESVSSTELSIFLIPSADPDGTDFSTRLTSDGTAVTKEADSPGAKRMYCSTLDSQPLQGHERQHHRNGKNDQTDRQQGCRSSLRRNNPPENIHNAGGDRD